MLEEKALLLSKFQEWSSLMLELEKREETVWNAPVAGGKWSVRELVSHMMLWDKYFCEEAIEKIAAQDPLTVRHLPFDVFNENAKRYGQETPLTVLFQQTIHYRQHIIHLIADLPENRYAAEYVDGDGRRFTIAQYLKDFLQHDEHHMRQLQQKMRFG